MLIVQSESGDVSNGHSCRVRRESPAHYYRDKKNKNCIISSTSDLEKMLSQETEIMIMGFKTGNLVNINRGEEILLLRSYTGLDFKNSYSICVEEQITTEILLSFMKKGYTINIS